MKIVEYGDDDNLVFVKYNPNTDLISIEDLDLDIEMTPQEALQLAGALQRACYKTQYFQGLRSKCT